MSRNEVYLEGNIIKEPIFFCGGKIPFVKFTVAVSEYYCDKKYTNYINCIAWAALAKQINETCSQDTEIELRGSLKSGKYVNKKGDNVYTTDVNVAEFKTKGIANPSDDVPF